jgi:RNA polymerase sigma-70 factor, ECF subfamily
MPGRAGEPTGSSGQSAASRHERFLSLLSPLKASLSRFARAMTGDTEAAKDLTSETILKAYESFDKLKDAGSFQSYLFTIASRLNQKERLRGKRWTEWDEERIAKMPASTPEPEIRIEVELLYQALQQLPEKQREAIVLFEISGLSLEEIKEIQGGSLSGVKSRIVRGRESLAELLGVNDERSLGATPTTRIAPVSKHTNRPLLAVATEVKQ